MTRPYKFFVYRDKRKEWRWALMATNGEPIANGGEGYKRRKDCLSAVERLRSMRLSTLEVEF